MTAASSTVPVPGAAAWFKSSYSGGEGNECVEIAIGRTAVGVRDSKDLHRSALTISTASFSAFVDGLKAAV
ncbi:DUF397 domain-containing protein [Streptomyces sp. NPDC050703]|uniref:DUF397 domain-containing protein n=1 Tax=Streptomyces sp. NPDC050703 TaxID=3157218 RepID=UPI003429732E